ncbi:phosphotransferase [Marisediminicola sp. LYQ134]|uniref:phosphotransferase n=1 Tax=Marisediminicola sp. LYQ134 TaxID=3391061 RepID=UPI003983854A
MARSPLTLAALATSAVDELDVTAAHRLGTGELESYEQAVLDTRDGARAIIRVPRTQTAESRASADLVALRALTAGVRGRLPFAVNTILGQTAVGSTRAVVYDFLPGEPVHLATLEAGSATSASIGSAIAAVHALPTSVVTDAGLAVARPLDTHATTIALMEQAIATGLVPAALVERWERASEDAGLWQYAPTVIHGSLSGDVILADSSRVTGIVDWHALSVGDPALDLFWTLGTSVSDVADSIIDSYTHSRGTADRQIRKRATLYSELEIAKWLLHGTRERSTDIVDDAVRMLHTLVDAVQNDLERSIGTDTAPVMTVAEVEDMLDRAKRQ